MKARLILLLALCALPALAEEIWGLEELEAAQKAAIVAFESDGGDVGKISGFSVKRTSDGAAARVEVYSITPSGSTATTKLFCHVHEGTEIDCH